LALGVPSFLLLPGFLMVTTFLAFRKRLPFGSPSTVTAKSTEFWLFAITLSLLAAFLYPIMTGVFGTSRDYLKGYEVKDVFQVWMGAVISGVVWWLGYESLRKFSAYLRNKYIEFLKRRKTPSEKDSPTDVLRKLARAHVKFPLKQADVTISGKSERYFVLQQGQKGKWVWVAPVMRWKWKRSDAKNRRGEFDTALHEARKDDKPETIANLFTQWEKENLIEVGWSKAASKKHPFKIEMSHAKITEKQWSRDCFEEG
jgi:succinate dehydrogenase hydrophobic anchor subunit